MYNFLHPSIHQLSTRVLGVLASHQHQLLGWTPEWAARQTGPLGATACPMGVASRPTGEAQELDRGGGVVDAAHRVQVTSQRSCVPATGADTGGR